MKNFLILAVVMMVAMAGGCMNKGKKASANANGSVTDIEITPTAPVAPAEYADAYGSPTYTTPIYDTPAVTQTPAEFAGAGTGGSYTVQKGDTLYGIARQNYGDGKQWQRIAAANPGVSPSSLKVGQTLTLP